jgi:aspartate kinase
MKVREVQIWTDVEGVLTADPNIVKSARPVDFLTFDEAAELAYFGTKFLHPKCIFPAMKNSIPLRIISTRKAEEPGTVISDPGDEENPQMKVIVYRNKLNLLTVTAPDSLMSYGFLVELFHIFNRYHVTVNSVATSDNSVSMTVGQDIESVPGLIQELDNIGSTNMKSGRAVVSVIGEGVRQHSDLANSISELMEHHGICVDVIARNPRNINLAFVIDQENIHRAIESLHNALFENNGCCFMDN